LTVSKKRALGTAHSAITVVSALPAGKGVTIGINLPCKITCEIVSRKNCSSWILVNKEVEDPHHLIETCVTHSLDSIGAQLDPTEALSITIDSDIPVARGLKSSSAVSVALVMAVLGLFIQKPDPLEVLQISSRASKASGASLTGAFDDAAACLLGGLVFSDNMKFRLLKHERVPVETGSHIRLLVPTHETKLTSSVNLKVYEKFQRDSRDAFRYASTGEIAQAMLMNSIIQCVALGYSLRPIVSALEEGATASGISGKGPAISALCRTSRVGERVAKRWREENEASRVISARVVQPKQVSRK
jgi:shikimate kinase